MTNRFSRKPHTKRYFDFSLLVIVLFLIAFGLVMIYSTSSYSANLEFGNGYFYLRRQLISTIVGIGVMFFTTFFPIDVYKKGWIPIIIYAFGLFSVCLILTPLGYTANGASRWIRIMGQSIQPAEIVKVCTILFTAALLTKMTPAEIRSWKSVIYIMLTAGVSAGLIYFITNNLSSAIIVCGIAYVMLITICRRSLKPYIVLAAIIAIAALVVLVVVSGGGANLGFRGARILAWINPEDYADGKGFQTLQALYGIGSGGFTGKGIGKSMQKLGFLPEAQNDMIFSIICEELGFFGGIAVLGAYLLLLWRIRDAASYCRDVFSNLIVTGVFAHLAIQVVLNVAVVTNTIPNTGISLPFISYGGSSVIFLLAEIGFVLNVSRNSVFVDEVEEDEEYKASRGE